MMDVIYMGNTLAGGEEQEPARPLPRQGHVRHRTHQAKINLSRKLELGPGPSRLQNGIRQQAGELGEPGARIAEDHLRQGDTWSPGNPSPVPAGDSPDLATPRSPRSALRQRPGTAIMKRYISSRTRAASEWQPSLAATGVGIRVRGGPAGQPVPRGRGGLGLGRWQAVLGGRAERQDGVDGLAGAVTVVGDAELVIVEGRQVGWQGEAEAVFVLGASPAARRPAGSVVACVDARSAGGVGEP